MVQVQPMSETIQGQQISEGTQDNSEKRDENQRVIMSTDNPSEASVSEANSEEETPEKKKSHWWVWLIVFLFLIGAGAAAYFFIFDKSLFGISF